MKFKTLLYLMFIAVLFSCGSSNNNSEEKEKASEEQVENINTDNLEFNKFWNWIKDNKADFSSSAQSLPAKWRHFLNAQGYAPITFIEKTEVHASYLVLYYRIADLGEPTYSFMLASYKDNLLQNEQILIEGEDHSCEQPKVRLEEIYQSRYVSILFPACSGDSGEPNSEFTRAEETKWYNVADNGTTTLVDSFSNYLPKSLQQLMDAQQLSVDEQRIYLLRATKLLSNRWKSLGKIDSSYFESLNFKYHVLDEFMGISMGFKVTEDHIKLILGDGRSADMYTVTALEIGESSYTVTYDQYDTPVTVKYTSNKDDYMLNNDFILSDSMHLLPNSFEVYRNPQDDMNYSSFLDNKKLITINNTHVYLTKDGPVIGTIPAGKELYLLHQEDDVWVRCVYILDQMGAIQVSVRTFPKTTELVVQQRHIKFGKDQLAIIGKDIWVRDAPATGKVVMKLNEGYKCTVLEKGFFEIIRGDADFWYKIEFETERGWVFGAQTSYKNMQTHISAATPDALWDRFKKHQKNWVDIENKGNPEEYGKYIYSENLNKFKVVWEGEGPSSFDYSLNAKSIGNLCIINETASLEGAMGFRNKWSSFLGIKSGTEFKMNADRSHKFDGKVENLIKVNEGEYILFTYQDSGEEIALYQESYYNVFYIKTSINTVRMIESELGLVYREETLYNARNGYAILGSSLEFIPNTTSFTLNEERHNIIDVENGYPSYTPFDTLTTTYIWNAKKKKYLKE